MVKQVTEWIAEDGTRRWRSTDLTHCSTEQQAKDYELRCSKLFLIRPLIAVELPQLCPNAQEAVARFIVKGGKALLEIMTSDEPFTGDAPPSDGHTTSGDVAGLGLLDDPISEALRGGEGQLGEGEEAQPGMLGAIGPDPCGPMPGIRDRSHPKPGREG